MTYWRYGLSFKRYRMSVSLKEKFEESILPQQNKYAHPTIKLKTKTKINK